MPNNKVKVIFIISLFIICNNCFSKTIVVGKDQLVTSLKKGIEAASDNDTILLKTGVYKEGNIILNKSIKLIGIDYPVLDGENKFEILTVSGTRIVIKGIHFKNSGYSSMNDFASINLVDAQFVIIENNKIDNAYFAILKTVS
jgi:nitrous oxidase accessory protein